MKGENKFMHALQGAHMQKHIFTFVHLKLYNRTEISPTRTKTNAKNLHLLMKVKPKAY